MDRVQLFNRAGDFVREVLVARTAMPADVISWEGRWFVLRHGRYVEGAVASAIIAEQQQGHDRERPSAA